MDTTKQQHILIVDDDQEIRSLLGDFLSQYGYHISLANDGTEMFPILDHEKVDLIVLDFMLPGEDGTVLCRKVRETSSIPIIMLTAVGTETDRILGLEMGADDYLAKPFNPRELLARIKAVFRRTTETAGIHTSKTGIYHFAGWRLETGSRSLYSPDEVEVTISAGEYDLLLALVENAQRVLSRDQLLDITKNREAGPFDRSVDVQISRLRHKMEADPKNPHLIKTVRGGGYMLTEKVTRS